MSTVSRGAYKGRSGRTWKRVRNRVKRSADVCWICGDTIDMTLKYPHPMAFSVDHVIPVSQLHPRDPLREDIANLRASHQRCNRGRGTGVPKRDATSRDW